MAGFDEFINILKDANKNKINSMNGLNGIIARLNESMRLENEKNDDVKETPEVKENADSKVAESNKIIMNSKIVKSDPQNNNQNTKEIFNLNISDDDLVRGIIFSEILGKPKSRRRRGAR